MVPLGRAATVREGDDLTIVTYGATVQRSLVAARELSSERASRRKSSTCEACRRTTGTRSLCRSNAPARRSSYTKTPYPGIRRGDRRPYRRRALRVARRSGETRQRWTPRSDTRRLSRMRSFLKSRTSATVFASSRGIEGAVNRSSGLAVVGLFLAAATAYGQAPAEPATEPVTLLVSISERTLTVHRGESTRIGFPGRSRDRRAARSGARRLGLRHTHRRLRDRAQEEGSRLVRPDWYYVDAVWHPARLQRRTLPAQTSTTPVSERRDRHSRNSERELGRASLEPRLPAHAKRRHRNGLSPRRSRDEGRYRSVT